LLALVDQAVTANLLTAAFADDARKLVPLRMQEEKERRAAFKAALKKSRQ
jgi:hypothetical protein